MIKWAYSNKDTKCWHDLVGQAASLEDIDKQSFWSGSFFGLIVLDGESWKWGGFRTTGDTVYWQMVAERPVTEIQKIAR